MFLERNQPCTPLRARLPRKVLIVGAGEGNVLWLWKKHLIDQGLQVDVAKGEAQAIECLRRDAYHVVVLDLVFQRGSALSVSDYAAFRRPSANLIFVNSDGFMADGMIFNLCPNARAVVQADSNPTDVAAIVAHYAGEV